MKEELKQLETEIEREIKSSQSGESLKKYLNKNSQLSLLFSKIKELDLKERVEAGMIINELKRRIIKAVGEKGQQKQLKKSDYFDITLPGQKPEVGHLHPLTQSISQARKIFEGMGFITVEGPEVEDEWHNFTALNFPKDHPAREMQDTLFIKGDRNLSERERKLMRTHTSPVQIRYMLDKKPPFRIIVPGRVFRNEATDASHEVNFYQMEGLMIDREVSAGNLKAIIEEFCHLFYQERVKIRLRPSFFPFTEPSFEVDVSCSTCQSRGCSVCSETGWVEIIGAGMVHPQVLINAKVDPKKWRGFAFGMGWDRIVMMKYKIDDIRLFYSGDLKFLNQF